MANSDKHTGVSSASLAEIFLQNFDHPTHESLGGAIDYCLMRAEESIKTFRITKDKRFSDAAAEYLSDAVRLQKAQEKLKPLTIKFATQPELDWRMWARRIISSRDSVPDDFHLWSDKALRDRLSVFLNCTFVE